jgi:histone deacetylase 6
MIAKVHGERYQEFIQYMWDESCKKSELYINTDTYYMKHTYQAAVAAVKTVILVTEAIIKKIYKYAYAVIRPPGHHSGLKNQPHGFSFFNNVALAAEFALKNERFKKIAIVDWDAHHG